MNNNLDSNFQTPIEVPEEAEESKETKEEKIANENHEGQELIDIKKEEIELKTNNEEKIEGNQSEIPVDSQLISEQNPDNQQLPDDQELNENQHPENNENNQEEMGLENNLGGLANAVSNAHLMSEESIETLRDILCSKDNIFYKLSLKDPDLNENILNILKLKGKIAENTIGEALNYYHQRFIDSELGHLDKLMRILKSKKRDMYLKKISPDSQEGQKEGETNAFSQFSNEQLMNQFDNPAQFTDYALEKSSSILKKILPEYNQQHRFIRFQLNQHYEVYLRVYEEKVRSKTSIIDRVPTDVLQNHIFVYFNSLDLFKLREVCSEWRDIIRSTWHLIFKREMMEQVIAADLCNDIEMNFKLMNIKSMFYHKFGILMKAITELIDWDTLKLTLDNPEVDYRAKYLVLSYYKMIGSEVGLDKIVDYNDEVWENFKGIAIEGLKDNVEKIFNLDFKFDSNYELDLVKKNFLDLPDINSNNIRNLGDKNLIMFQLFLRQLSVFSQLKNYLSLAQTYIIYAKNKLKEVSREWPSKKGFLEGAYKILLFKFVQIKNGEVIIAKDDEDEHRHDILKDIQNELHQCINITSEIHSSDQEIDTQKLFLGSNKKSQENNSPEKSTTDMNESEKKISEGQDKQEESVEITTEKTQDPDSPTAEPSSSKQDSTTLQIDDLMNYYLGRIIEIRKGKKNMFFENFLRGENPDYVIAKNNSETRLYLDDMIKIELLIQKYLKLHLIRTMAMQESKEKEPNNEEITHEEQSQIESNEKNEISEVSEQKQIDETTKNTETQRFNESEKQETEDLNKSI